MPELAAFFGNPGAEHAGNRHNVPWHLARSLPFYDLLNWKKKFKGIWADIDNSRLSPYLKTAPQNPAGILKLNGQTGAEDMSGAAGLAGNEKYHFLMPGTYMNRSGESVREAASFHKIKTENIIVIHDELELPLGTISLKFGGGLGGHNGLRSMRACFGTADFWRLRIGIGRPDSRLPGEGGPEGSGRGIYEWVLSDFTSEESGVLEPVFAAAANLLLAAMITDPADLLPFWAKKKITRESA